MPHGKGKKSYDMYGRSVMKPPKVKDPEEVLNTVTKPKKKGRMKTRSRNNQAGR